MELTVVLLSCVLVGCVWLERNYSIFRDVGRSPVTRFDAPSAHQLLDLFVIMILVCSCLIGVPFCKYVENVLLGLFLGGPCIFFHHS